MSEVRTTKTSQRITAARWEVLAWAGNKEDVFFRTGTAIDCDDFLKRQQLLLDIFDFGVFYAFDTIIDQWEDENREPLDMTHSEFCSYISNAVACDRDMDRWGPRLIAIDPRPECYTLCDINHVVSTAFGAVLGWNEEQRAWLEDGTEAQDARRWHEDPRNKTQD